MLRPAPPPHTHPETFTLRDRLPMNTSTSLTYGELIATLGLLVGEHVCVPIQDGTPDGAQGRSSFQATGALRRLPLPWAPAFAVGDVFTLVLDEPDFEAASLWTFDGNRSYEVRLQFGDVHLKLGTPERVGTDEGR